jgi:hypothetical protein
MPTTTVPRVVYCGAPRGRSQGENPVGTVEIEGPDGEQVIVHFYSGHKVRLGWGEATPAVVSEFYGTSQNRTAKVVLERR